MGMADFPKALDAFSYDVTICRKSGNKRNLCSCVCNIAIIYNVKGDNKKALEFDTMALAIAEQINFKRGISSLQANIADVYNTLKDSARAMQYFDSSIVSAQKFGFKEIVAMDYGNIAGMYADAGNLPKALAEKFKALVLIKETGKKNDIGNTYLSIGDTYFSMKNYAIAKAYTDSSLAIAKTIGELQTCRDIYSSYYKLDSVKGDYKAMLGDYKKYTFYVDSIANQASFKKTTQAELNYAFARKSDSAQVVQDEQNLKVQQDNYRQRVIRNVLIVGFILAFIASGIFFMQRRRIAKDRKQLQETNAVKDKLFSIISHDLRSPINLLHGMLGLFKRGKISAENTEALSQNLESSMQNTMSLLDNLLTWSHSQMKGFNIKPEKLKLGEVTNEIINLYSNAAKQKGVNIETELANGIELDADKNIIQLVLRNLLSNAIKFSNSGGNILISTFNKEGQTGFSVKDNGIGIPAESLQNLFKLGDSKKQRSGTANETGSGLGLVLCDELVTRAGGNLKVESEVGKGTNIEVLFPSA
jgi:signal transduction histidine kinase